MAFPAGVAAATLGGQDWIGANTLSGLPESNRNSSFEKSGIRGRRHNCEANGSGWKDMGVSNAFYSGLVITLVMPKRPQRRVPDLLIDRGSLRDIPKYFVEMNNWQHILSAAAAFATFCELGFTSYLHDTKSGLQQEHTSEHNAASCQPNRCSD